MAEPFSGLPSEWVHPLSLTLCYVVSPVDLAETMRIWRPIIKAFLEEKFPHCIVRLRAEISPVWLDRSAKGYPDDALPVQYRGKPLPHVPAFKVGLHGLIFVPNMTRGEVEKTFRNGLTGPRRVHIGEITEVEVDEDGNETGGVQGWGEYAGKEEFESKLFEDDDIDDGVGGHDNYSIFQDYLRLEATWKRQSRLIKYRDSKKNVQDARLRHGASQSVQQDAAEEWEDCSVGRNPTSTIKSHHNWREECAEEDDHRLRRDRPPRTPRISPPSRLQRPLRGRLKYLGMGGPHRGPKHQGFRCIRDRRGEIRFGKPTLRRPP